MYVVCVCVCVCACVWRGIRILNLRMHGTPMRAGEVLVWVDGQMMGKEERNVIIVVNITIVFVSTTSLSP